MPSAMGIGLSLPPSSRGARLFVSTGRVVFGEGKELARQQVVRRRQTESARAGIGFYIFLSGPRPSRQASGRPTGRPTGRQTDRDRAGRVGSSRRNLSPAGGCERSSGGQLAASLVPLNHAKRLTLFRLEPPSEALRMMAVRPPGC